jgi:hypothetical protein
MQIAWAPIATPPAIDKSPLYEAGFLFSGAPSSSPA